MLAAVRSATLIGVDGQPVTVEVHVSSGLPAYQVVGLPDAAVRESRERVRAAVLSSGLPWPQNRITVNLAPGDVRKTGSGLELAVALGVLGANDALPAGVLDGVAVLGELGLDGSVRPVPGTLALVDALARSGAQAVVVPLANACRGGARGRRAGAGCPHLGRAAGVPEGRGAVARLGPAGRCPPTTPLPTACSTTKWSTSPTYAACRSPARRSRWRPRADTTSCSADHRARARRCWRGASAPSSLRSRTRGAGGHPHPLGRGHRGRRSARPSPPVPRAASHRVDGRAGRWRQRSRPTGRDHARAPRHPVPGRARRVRADRARRLAPTA